MCFSFFLPPLSRLHMSEAFPPQNPHLDPASDVPTFDLRKNPGNPQVALKSEMRRSWSKRVNMQVFKHQSQASQQENNPNPLVAEKSNDLSPLRIASRNNVLFSSHIPQPSSFFVFQLGVYFEFPTSEDERMLVTFCLHHGGDGVPRASSDVSPRDLQGCFKPNTCFLSPILESLPVPSVKLSDLLHQGKAKSLKSLSIWRSKIFFLYRTSGHVNHKIPVDRSYPLASIPVQKSKHFVRSLCP